MENTGHRSIQGVRLYKRSSDQQKKVVSHVLNNATSENHIEVAVNITDNSKKICQEQIKGITFNHCTDIHVHFNN